MQPCLHNSIFRVNNNPKTMKTVRFLSIILLLAATLSSCDWHTTRTIIGYGDVESEVREVTDFSGVSLTGTSKVYITTGESFSLELEAQPQILEVMTADVRSGILSIGFHPDYNIRTEKEISAFIVVPSLDFISLNGAGDFEISGDKQTRLDIHITGKGNVEAFGLEVADCNIDISGVGNCEVNVSDKLDIQISGVGHIYYMGNPQLKTDFSGVGNASAVDY